MSVTLRAAMPHRPMHVSAPVAKGSGKQTLRSGALIESRLPVPKIRTPARAPERPVGGNGRADLPSATSNRQTDLVGLLSSSSATPAIPVFF